MDHVAIALVVRFVSGGRASCNASVVKVSKTVSPFACRSRRSSWISIESMKLENAIHERALAAAVSKGDDQHDDQQGQSIEWRDPKPAPASYECDDLSTGVGLQDFRRNRVAVESIDHPQHGGISKRESHNHEVHRGLYGRAGTTPIP